MNRIFDLSDSPAKLFVRNGLVCIAVNGDSQAGFLPSEIASIVLSHPQISCSQSVLALLAENGVALVTCNDKRMPVGMLLPLSAHFTQGERFRAQSVASLPMKKRLWKAIVKCKITQQASVLNRLFGADYGLSKLSKNVKSGDITNVEAWAAKKYWSRLFPGMDFKREPDAIDQNQLLNYGYAVLRAITARAICGVGLHPTFGLFHRNRYSAFCLADDLMEPFRPIVDWTVAKIVGKAAADTPLDLANRRQVLQSLYVRWETESGRRTIFETVEQLASSLAGVFLGNNRQLQLPRAFEFDDAILGN